ncbi:hypothetical protein OHB12_21425 [Nocardia sp. NBC_01730]|nr:hypothetical protein OHB12_21425 [Nocardia sp. NBC_01730]
MPDSITVAAIACAAIGAWAGCVGGGQPALDTASDYVNSML